MHGETINIVCMGVVVVCAMVALAIGIYWAAGGLGGGDKK